MAKSATAYSTAAGEQAGFEPGRYHSGKIDGLTDSQELDDHLNG
jgi:hypothetical protein